MVFVEETTEAITSANALVCDGGRVGDRLREWVQRSGIGDASMGSVRVVVPFVLAEGVEQVGLVPDECAVE